VEKAFLPPPKGSRRVVPSLWEPLSGYKLNSYFLLCTGNAGSNDKVFASATFSDLLERFAGFMEEATQKLTGHQ